MSKYTIKHQEFITMWGEQEKAEKDKKNALHRIGAVIEMDRLIKLDKLSMEQRPRLMEMIYSIDKEVNDLADLIIKKAK